MIEEKHIGEKIKMPSWCDHEFIEVLAIHKDQIWGFDEIGRYNNYVNSDLWVVLPK